MVLSRRNRAIVAWHEVPGTSPPQESRPVGYGMILAVLPRHFVPGYDRIVPTGRKYILRAEALIKLGLMGLQPWEPDHHDAP